MAHADVGTARSGEEVAGSSVNSNTVRDGEAAGRRDGDVARLGLGLAAIGRPAYITPGRSTDLPGDRSPAALQARTDELLAEAVRLRIGYIDVARSYGRAEQFLGDWLRGHESTAFVASKWGYAYTGGWRADATQHEVKEHSLPALQRQWEETDQLLGPWLRLYQVHSLTVDSPLWGDPALLQGLAALRVLGVELGFSTSGPAQADALRRGLDLTVDGVPLFTSVQTTWNLLEPSAGDALADAHAGGARVVIKEALANGRLTTHGGAADDVLARVARQHGVSIDAVALAAALAQPWSDVVLCGPVTVDQLRQNVAARDLVSSVDVDELLRPEFPPEYWSRRSSLKWA